MTDPLTRLPGPPLPRPGWLRQRWLDVAFLHWRVDADRVAALLPAGTRPHEIDGATYVGLVCFRLLDAGLPQGPALLPPFVETNVRVYAVDDLGRHPGVVFLSMDVTSAVMAASGRAPGLPYRWARGGYRHVDGTHEYVTLLPRRGDPRLRSRALVRPDLSTSAPDDPLATFLTGRWGLLAPRFGRTWHLRNTHEIWPLHTAEVIALEDDLVPAAGFPEVATRAPDHVAWSPGVDARFGAPELLRLGLAP